MEKDEPRYPFFHAGNTSLSRLGSWVFKSSVTFEPLETRALLKLTPQIQYYLGRIRQEILCLANMSLVVFEVGV